MLVTVLLPVYNAADQVERAARSILAQDHEDLELLVVDDGSTDATLERVGHLKDGRIRIVRLPHEGLTAALRHGLGEARGEFVARQDADDVSHPSRLSTQLAFLNSRPDVALIGTGVRLVDRSGRVLGCYSYPPDHEGLERQLMALLNPLPHTTVMFRRHAVLQCGGYRPPFVKAQDYDISLRLAERYRLASVPEALCDLECSMTSVTGADDNGQQLEYAALALVCATIRRDGRPDPLDLPDGADFEQRFREWYRSSPLPSGFRSRLWRRAARLEWAKRRYISAARAVAYSVHEDRAWLIERLSGRPSNHLAAAAMFWAEGSRPR